MIFSSDRGRAVGKGIDIMADCLLLYGKHIKAAGNRLADSIPGPVIIRRPTDANLLVP